MPQASKSRTALDDSRTVADALLETDVINGLRTGALQSPTRLGESLYYRMRMTGTGDVTRGDEATYRDPKQYINQDFVKACIGLPLLLEHPPTGRIGPDDVIVGTTVAAYLYNAESDTPEVWVIGRVINGEAQETLLTEKMSTSPSVIVGESPDGFSEGSPLNLDHLALVPQGVWDHQGEPQGIDQEIILNDSISPEVNSMTSDELNARIEALVSEKLQAALSQHQTKADEAGLNPVAPNAVMADETAQAVTPVASDAAQGVLPTDGVSTANDADVSEGGNVAADEAPASADAETKSLETRADAEECETKADADEPAEGETKADAEEAEGKTNLADSDTLADSKDSNMNDKKYAALEAQVALLTQALAGKTTLSDSEAADLSTARVHADNAMRSVGKAAMQPFPGEKPLAFRKRVLNELKCHSTAMKDADFSTIADSATLGLIEKQIFADAAASARSGAGVAKNTLRARTRNEGGHTITEYDGQTRTWLQESDLNASFAGRV